MGKMVDALRRVQQQRHRVDPAAEAPRAGGAASDPGPTPPTPASVPEPSPSPAPAPVAPAPSLEDAIPHVSIPQVSAGRSRPAAVPEEEPAPEAEEAFPEPVAYSPPPRRSASRRTPEPAPRPAESYAAEPAQAPGTLARHLVAYYDRNDEVSEQYRTLRTNLLAQNPTGQPQAIVFTAPGREEGTTTTVLNLAITIADSGEKRVLVVDADMRHGDVARNMGVASHPGLSDLLADEAALDAVIQPTIVENLDVIAAGRPIANTAELLGSTYARQLIQALKDRYDLVLIDTPAMSWSDASVAARACDGVYLVVTMGETHREKVDRAIRQVEAAGGRVLGCVLTKMRYYIPGPLYRRT